MQAGGKEGEGRNGTSSVPDTGGGGSSDRSLRRVESFPARAALRRSLPACAGGSGEMNTVIFLRVPHEDMQCLSQRMLQQQKR